MRFLVLGARVARQLFRRLAAAGRRGCQLSRGPKRAAEARRGRGSSSSFPTVTLRQRVRTLLAGRIDGRYDVILLACKTYDLESAIEAVAPALGENGAILPVLNGIGHITTLADRLVAGRVLGGLTNVAAARSPRRSDPASGTLARRFSAN